MSNVKQHSKQVKIIRVAEVIAQYNANKDVEAIKITSSSDAQHLIKKIYPVDLQLREAMVALFLNRANTTIGYSIVSIGGVAGTICDPKVLFQAALLCNASAIIIAHNHPSGNLNPSKADEALTNRVNQGAKLLEISFLDHLIITQDGYYSFADSGRL